MFTGIVQCVGRVTAMTADTAGGAALTVTQSDIAKTLQLGESIAVNGACLTVTRIDESTFDFQAGPETLARTTLGKLQFGDAVNLECALRLGDPLGGHWVTGHVDGIGTIASITKAGEWQTVWFDCDPSFSVLMVHKGSICVDGVSLTLVDVEIGRFSVMLIPHTLHHTTLGGKTPGDTVNLEIDILAKHVQKLFQNMTIVI
jgi:riboflavin synthase